MRIVIEDNEPHDVEISRPSIEAPAELMHRFIDAGPAPMELLRRLGHVSPAEPEVREAEPKPAKKDTKVLRASSATRPERVATDSSLNPLRQGEVVARTRLKAGAATKVERAEPVKTADAGSAPKAGGRKKKG